jgi:ABC-type antimicrobial peptide transport system permease subunit
VNESFARFYYGSLDVVGRGGRPQIVGVVRDARYDGPREDSPRAMFVPYQQVRARPAMTYVVRAVLNRSAALSAARAAVRQAGAGAQVSTTSLDDQAQSTVWRELFLARLSAALALMATMLACGGVYAVVSGAVVERRREIGIRMALGARRRDIVPLVVAQPLLTALAGLAVGLPVAAFMMRGIRSLLFGIASFDPTTILAGAASIIAITFVAALVPAWRACAADPRQAFLAG